MTRVTAAQNKARGASDEREPWPCFIRVLLDENVALQAALNKACDWLKRVQEHYDPTDSEKGIQDIERLRRGDAS